MTDRTRQEAAALRLRLTKRQAKGHPATVRVTKHTNNAAIKDAALFPSREPLDRRAVRALIEAGRLAETYRQGLVTDYELAEGSGTTSSHTIGEILRRHEPETTEDFMPEPLPVSLPPPGNTITAVDLAPLLGVSSSRVCQLVKARRIRGYKDGPKSSRAPYHITVDEDLLAEFDKRGVAYEVEGEACTRIVPIPAEACEDRSESCTDPAEADTDEPLIAKVILPEYSVEMGDGQDDEPLPPASQEEREAPGPGGPICASRLRHPVEAIADELFFADVERVLVESTVEDLVENLRSATLRFVHVSLQPELSADVEDARDVVVRAYRLAEERLDELRGVLDEAERIAGLNELPAVRLRGAPSDEDS